jgi:hypothetical protein
MQSLNQHTQQAVTGIVNRKIVGGGEETSPWSLCCASVHSLRPHQPLVNYNWNLKAP